MEILTIATIYLSFIVIGAITLFITFEVLGTLYNMDRYTTKKEFWKDLFLPYKIYVQYKKLIMEITIPSGYYNIAITNNCLTADTNNQQDYKYLKIPLPTFPYRKYEWKITKESFYKDHSNINLTLEVTDIYYESL